ncbi:hypothetical protein ACFLZ5_11000 [Thermodesulfobacteriota bacterium]
MVKFNVAISPEADEKVKNDNGNGIKFYFISMEIQKRCKTEVMPE